MCTRFYTGKTLNQGRPEKLRGPGQRVKVGTQGQGGFHSESQLHPRKAKGQKKPKRSKKKTKKKRPKKKPKTKTKDQKTKDQKKGHYMLTMTIASPHQPYLLIYKLATLLL